MGVSAGDLRALSEGGTEGSASDLERVLPQHRLSPQVCDPAAERTAAREAAEASTAARSELRAGNAGRADGGVGGGRPALVGTDQGVDRALNAWGSQECGAADRPR